MANILSSIVGTVRGLTPESRIRDRLEKTITGVRDLPGYGQENRRAGDIFITYIPERGYIGHANMTAKDLTRKVESLEATGVRMAPIDSQTAPPALVYRMTSAGAAEIAQAAALLAEDWSKEGTKVGYADDVKLAGVPIRAIGAAFGSSKFGTGAQGRLAKYADRDKTPKNVICSEMCILAYQLVMGESHAAFIRLDAKHTTPTALIDYFEGAGKASWSRVAFKATGIETPPARTKPARRR